MKTEDAFFDSLYEALHNHENSRRGTGRTTAAIQAMKDGDVYVSSNARHAIDCRKIMTDTGIKGAVLSAVDERDLMRMFQTQFKGYKGTIHIDHELKRIITLKKIADGQKMIGICQQANKPFGKE